ncbi:uncharacterized protein LOC132206172 isoform X2 [Stegostoma tigrinum]|uniref:uncharacterized protein LOC132206172 isoform X2 n=1 Tax=Stegostoma tigrinum TaxID=3053191 RepID=UPI00286FFB1E|nr:uncharacterized protein LOC132206172 isoform X2 [Stegostoma tigrinum]
MRGPDLSKVSGFWQNRDGRESPVYVFLSLVSLSSFPQPYSTSPPKERPRTPVCVYLTLSRLCPYDLIDVSHFYPPPSPSPSRPFFFPVSGTAESRSVDRARERETSMASVAKEGREDGCYGRRRVISANCKFAVTGQEHDRLWKMITNASTCLFHHRFQHSQKSAISGTASRSSSNSPSHKDKNT